MDDVGGLTDANGWVCVQAKKKLMRSDRPDSDLAAALGQLVTINAEGVPEQPPRQNELRSLDPQLDRVLILTDDEAPSTIADAMACVVDRLRTWPEGVPLAEAATNAGERAALRTLRGHLERLWAERHGEAADEGVVRSLVRPLAVRALDLRPEGSDLQAVPLKLRDLLENPGKAPDLWRELELIGQRLAVERSWIRRVDLVQELEARGLHLTPVERLRRDIQRLQQVTADNLDSPPTSLVLATADGPIKVNRAVSALLDAPAGNVAITGEPGTGKSVLLHRFAARQTGDVVYLTHHQLRGTAGQTRSELNLGHELHKVLTGWTGSRTGLLLLDGIDQTRGVEASSWLPEFARRLRPTRWRIIASIRSFDLRHGPGWQAMFSGKPINAGHADAELPQVAHLLVGDLTAEEIVTVRAASASVDKLFNRAGDRLTALLANPFNLNLAGELVSAEVDVSRIRSRLDLLTRFWQLRVTDAPDGRVRQRVVQTLVGSMIVARSQQVRDSQLHESAMLAALDGLLHDGVLREGPAGRWATSRPIEFAHPVLFDYAAATVALGDLTVSDSLAERLDADPDLAMLLRPSLDYRLAIAWHDDPSRTSYWRLALRLAAQRSGHMLAAAAAATVAARELQAAAELKLLETSCVRVSDDAAWTIEDARALTFLVAAGLDTAGTNQAGLDAFGQLLVALAGQAVNNDDVGLAFLVAQLSCRAAADHPPTVGTLAAECWVRAAKAATEVGLKDVNDPRRANLADHCGRALATAATLDAAVTADVIRSLIAEPALRGWGVRAVRPLIDVLPQIAAQDPDLAVDLGASVWRFQDDPSQPTNILNSQILPLISNRQQDLEQVQYQVSQKFPALAAVDVLAATRLLIRTVEDRVPGGYGDIESHTDHKPWVRSSSIGYPSGQRLLPAMADTLINRIEELAPAVSDVIELLIQRLTHADVWNRLLHRAATSTSPALATALRPVLSSPSLFAHSRTWPAAGRLAARLAPGLSEAAHHALEHAILTATEPDAENPQPRRDDLRERREALLNALAAGRAGTDAAAVLPHLLPSNGRPHRVGAGTGPPPQTAEPRLLHEVDQALEMANQAGERDAANRRLTTLWPQLATAHAAEPANQQLHERLLRAARHIACLPEVLPDTAMGEQVLAVVRAALPQPCPTGGQPGINSDRLASWACTPETEALSAASDLLARPEWRRVHGDELRACLTSHLDSSEWVYRFLSTAAISLIFTDPDELLSQVEIRLTTETDDHVATRLIHALGCYVHVRPSEVDDIFARLAALRGSPYLFAPDQQEAEIYDRPAEAVVQRLTTLAVRYSTRFAEATVRGWLSSPIAHATTVVTTAAHLRALLNPADPSLRDAQQRAFDLLTLTLEPLHAARGDATTAASVFKVAEAVAREVYYASGALQEQNNQEELGDPVVFATLALPLLGGIGKLQHPALTHIIIETTEHLSGAQPKEALLLAMRATTDDPRYATERLGVDAVLKMINRYTADHRELILGDPECTTAVRVLLEQFVRAGWPRAIQMAERMDESFR